MCPYIVLIHIYYTQINKSYRARTRGETSLVLFRCCTRNGVVVGCSEGERDGGRGSERDRGREGEEWVGG